MVIWISRVSLLTSRLSYSVLTTRIGFRLNKRAWITYDNLHWNTKVEQTTLVYTIRVNIYGPSSFVNNRANDI